MAKPVGRFCRLELERESTTNLIEPGLSRVFTAALFRARK